MLDRLDPSSERKITKSNEKSNKKSEYAKRLSPIIVESDVE